MVVAYISEYSSLCFPLGNKKNFSLLPYLQFYDGLQKRKSEDINSFLVYNEYLHIVQVQIVYNLVFHGWGRWHLEHNTFIQNEKQVRK